MAEAQTKRDLLAQMAVAPIESGMRVGLGTGRAASRGIRALAERVRVEGLRVQCAATSSASHGLARSLDLRVIPLGEVSQLDYLFDGADEFDEALHLLKGGGGAMTQERIAADMSEHRVYMVQESKRVARLGERCLLGIEVIEAAQNVVVAHLAARGLSAAQRMSEGGESFVTDNGHPVLDAELGAVELDMLAAWLDRTPGVVGHGLFLDQADVVLVEDASGEVTQLNRAR